MTSLIMSSQHVTPQKPLQRNSNMVVQFEFELEIHASFH